MSLFWCGWRRPPARGIILAYDGGHRGGCAPNKPFSDSATFGGPVHMVGCTSISDFPFCIFSFLGFSVSASFHPRRSLVLRLFHNFIFFSTAVLSPFPNRLAATVFLFCSVVVLPKLRKTSAGRRGNVSLSTVPCFSLFVMWLFLVGSRWLRTWKQVIECLGNG